MPRPVLVFASDIHLTDTLKPPSVPLDETLRRFATRIDAVRGDAPAELVFVGDLFDVVRSPRWLETSERPYRPGSTAQSAVVEAIVASTLAREKPFFDLLRSFVEGGRLNVRYLLGNHDRLLAEAPRARRAIWKAMTGRDEDVTFPNELTFPEHSAIAYHGHTVDMICSTRDGSPPIGDAIGLELIVRFPRLLRQRLGVEDPELDDIDDVRPVYAVPAWVRQIGDYRRGLMKPLAETWTQLVEEFLSNPFVRDWMRAHKRPLGFDAGTKLALLLELSTGKIMSKTQDYRLTQVYKLFQHAFDGRFAERAAEALTRHPGYRYVVNGHSHFASMTPLGRVDGKPACYFNTGTWRTVHQIGHHLGGRPSFLRYDAMSYVVFFADGDAMGRDFEWWNGALVARERAAPRAE